jgi:protein YibB
VAVANITIITAFFDIKRESWKGFERSVNFYLESFSRLSRIENQIIVYTSEDLVDTIKKVSDKITVISYDFMAESENIRKDIKSVQSNVILKNKTNKSFLNNPEFLYPEYVAVNMYKPVFVLDAISKKIIKNDLIAWIDFGYCRNDSAIPTNSWSYEFNPEKINLFSIKEINKKRSVKSIAYLNDVYIQGCHIVTGSEGWSTLHRLMFKNFYKMLSMSLIHNDQTVLLMSYLENENAFQIHKNDPNDWFRIFKDYNNIKNI